MTLPARDRVGEFFSERTPRRALAIAVFVGLLVVFWKVLPLLVFFVAFERGLGGATDVVRRRLGTPEKPTLLGVVLVALGLVAAAATFGAGRAIRAATHAHEIPERIARLEHHPLYERFRERVGDTDRVLDVAKRYASEALRVAGEVGHVAVLATVGFILAVVFLLERKELATFRAGVDAKSLVGTLVRWLGYLADAVSVTIQLQLVVAACNTALTLPVLLLLGVKHVPALMILIFVSGLVPVIGNLVSGVVLALVAWQAHGWLGVGVLVALTAVLHKIEAYYLNPRLTARHVRLPGFVLIVSLIAWEHLLGFAGLFVSFPVLFLAGKIRAEMRAEEVEAEAATARSAG